MEPPKQPDPRSKGLQTGLLFGRSADNDRNSAQSTRAQNEYNETQKWEREAGESGSAGKTFINVSKAIIVCSNTSQTSK